MMLWYSTQTLTSDISFFPENKPHRVLIYDNFGLKVLSTFHF